VILFSPSTNGGLAQVAGIGGPSTPVAREGFGRPANGPRWPQFLPDGRHFLCYLQLAAPDTRGEYLGSLDGGDMVRVFLADTAAVYVAPGYLLQVRKEQLVAWRFDVANASVSGDPIVVTDAVGSDNTIGHGAFSVSSTGVLVYRAGTRAQRRQLMWVDRAGRALGMVGAADDTTSPAGPELAPDGGRVAQYQSVQGNSDVWLTDVARGIQSRFTFDASSDSNPVWSPDGKRVVFSSSRNGVYDLFEKPSSGAGEERPLLVTADAKYPLSWSADGHFVLYRSTNTETNHQDLWALPMIGERTPFRVVQTAFDETEAQFSPDGHWLAYSSNESRRSEILIRPFPGPGETTQVSTAGGSQVRWRKDGKELYYVDPDTRLVAVSVVAPLNTGTLDIGSPVPLFLTHLATGANVIGLKPQYAVAPDGHFLLNTRVDDDTTPPLVVVVNWTEELQRVRAERR